MSIKENDKHVHEDLQNHEHEHCHHGHHHHHSDQVNDYLEAVNEYRKTFATKEDVL